jgi:AcrR family transcriptional regulator
MADARGVAKPADTYHHGDLRQALIKAALTKVDQDGPESISLAAIAKALGVSQAAPYRHFSDRDALLTAVAAEAFKLFVEALDAAIASTSPRPLLSRMCRAYVRFGVGRRGLYRLMFASTILGAAQDDSELKTIAKYSFNMLVDAIEPLPRPGARERRALKIWVGLHGIVMLACQNLLYDRDDIAALEGLVEDILA